MIRFLTSEVGRGALIVRSRLWDQRVLSSKPDSTDDPSCIGPVDVKSYVEGQTFSRWCGAEACRGSSNSCVVVSSDRGSKLRKPSQNSPRVSSKRDVNITKTTTKKKTKT
ncbi:hypothetical protein AVEN_89555-1 [Araneus ventricosus]|uniref:Uncharacterized protein n=1 Tax=Araneus ventricosus TaxID=182803 RepID=A0A4Y2N0D8_ARAVE|nr:hypothetical protein AVEN_89555-1 [Araneus ventricosus]